MELFEKKVEFYDEHAKKQQSNFFPPAVGLKLVQKGTHAFHVEDSLAYKIIEDTFTEKEICEVYTCEFIAIKLIKY